MFRKFLILIAVFVLLSQVATAQTNWRSLYEDDGSVVSYRVTFSGVTSATSTNFIRIPDGSDLVALQIRNGTDTIYDAQTVSGAISSVSSFQAILLPREHDRYALSAHLIEAVTDTTIPSVYQPFSTGNGAAVTWYATNPTMTNYGIYLIPAYAADWLGIKVAADCAASSPITLIANFRRRR